MCLVGLGEKNDLIDLFFVLIFFTEQVFMWRCQLTLFKLALALSQWHTSVLEEDILVGKCLQKSNTESQGLGTSTIQYNSTDELQNHEW